MNRKDYERLRRQIEERAATDLAALDRVWELSGGSQNGSTHRPGELADKVKKAIEQFGQNEIFTKRILTLRLRESEPSLPEPLQNLVGAVLKRLDDAGEIAQVRVGKGKRPTEYIRRSYGTDGTHGTIDDSGEALPLA